MDRTLSKNKFHAMQRRTPHQKLTASVTLTELSSRTVNRRFANRTDASFETLSESKNRGSMPVFGDLGKGYAVIKNRSMGA